MKLNSQLTVILPLKGREDYTIRILEYLCSISFPYKLIIADGSKGDEMLNVLKNSTSYNAIKFKYIKYPFDQSFTEYYKKMVSALKEVDTPYVALLDNDCFPILEGLAKSVEFLEKNPDYSVCRGQHIDFSIYDQGQSNDYAETKNYSHILIDPTYYDKRHTIWESFEANSPLDRILRWGNCTNIMHYNVYRVRVLSEAWEFIAKNDCMDLFFCEIALAMHALAHGKTKVLEHPFLLRQQNSSDSVSRDFMRKMDILDRMLYVKWTSDINQLIDCVAKICSKNYGEPFENFLPGIRQAIKNHYSDRLYMLLKKREINKNSSGYRADDSAKKIEINKIEDADHRIKDPIYFMLHKNFTRGD